MQQPRIFFAVALHEKYALPTDALYTPIQAGAAIHPPLGLMRDDTGENISAKNGSYCELTVLYWTAHNVMRTGTACAIIGGTSPSAGQAARKSAF